MALGCALACAGCSSILGIDELTLADAGPPADTAFCYGTLATRCYDAPPTGDVTLSGTIDTASDVRCEPFAQPAGPELCLIATGTITIDASGVVATGARPLMLVAADTITVTGTLDVASRRGVQVGAGANAAACPALAAGGTARHGGGGAGGSFGTAGQIGGRGGGDVGEDGAGGVNGPSQDATFVRGGCAGAPGGGGMVALPGAGGDGGGAMYLVAGTSITVAGQLQASGAGGLGPAASSSSSGGGGGGAGGLVGLEAPMIDVTGSVVANGGGGGEGGGETLAGAPGDNGSVFNAAAIGGGGTTEGGDGGTGFAIAIAPTPGGQGTTGTGAHGGGGGGGGGAGVVWVKGTLSDASTSVSPAPTVAQ